MFAYNREHDRVTRARWILFWLLLISGAAYMECTAVAAAAHPGPAPATIAEVLAGTGGSSYVSVSGTLEAGSTGLCPSDGRCDAAGAVLSDGRSGASIFVYFGGTLPGPGADGLVTVTGFATDGSGRSFIADWRSAGARRGLKPIPDSDIYLDATWSPPNLIMTAAAASSLIFLDLLIALGWLTGLVPYVTFRGGGSVPVGSGGLLSSTRVRITGVIVDIRGTRRCYRHRPADLVIENDALLLSIHPWNYEIGVRTWSPLPLENASLKLAVVGRASFGTAFLVNGARPAVALRPRTGRALLTFDDVTSRAAALAALKGLPGHPAQTLIRTMEGNSHG
jgi:hypothetical protein